jgi:hypothetical protein
MKVVEVPFKLELARDPRRSGGLHQSSIVRGIALRSGFLEAKYADDEEMDPVLVTIGLAFEDYIFRHHHPDVVYHPEEVECDGIKQSYDGIVDFDEGEYTQFWGVKPADFGYLKLVEAKTTHKSSRGLDNPSVGFANKKFWMWMAQIKGYCYTMETRWAVLHALFLRGAYGKGWDEVKPQYRIFNFEFTEWELQENWSMLVNNKHLGKEE